MPEILHATAVALAGRGLILTGPPGSGKSALALRLIEAGALLVADDRLVCRAAQGQLLLSAPPAIAGLIEVRGLGIASMPHTAAPAVLLLDCGAAVERMPQPWHRTIAGIAIPCLAFDAHDAAAAARARLALALAAAGRLWQEPDHDRG